LIPANSIKNTLRVEFDSREHWMRNSYGFITLKSVLDQNNINTFETATKGYNLLSIGFGGSFSIFKKDVDFRVSGNNILDEEYIAHLSRLKTDGIANIGRNISLGLSAGL
jgi:iron complex outermembrane receptor protein